MQLTEQTVADLREVIDLAREALDTKGEDENVRCYPESERDDYRRSLGQSLTSCDRLDELLNAPASNQFTVILAYPYDDSTGTQTYVSHVTSDSSEDAVKLARAEAREDNKSLCGAETYGVDDFELLMIIEGHAKFA